MEYGPLKRDAEPRWPVMLAMLGVGILHLALPTSWMIRPAWLPLLVVAILAIPAAATHKAGRLDLNLFFGHVLAAVVTLVLITNLGLLIWTIPTHRGSAIDLLRGGACLWISNVLVFSSWYWRLDAGGPHHRERREEHVEGAFLFPQMTMSPEDRLRAGIEDWSPGFVDYLFLAFNTSTALSPADTPVLSRWAKAIMMVQASISFTVIVLVVARAVNVM